MQVFMHDIHQRFWSCSLEIHLVTGPSSRPCLVLIVFISLTGMTGSTCFRHTTVSFSFSCNSTVFNCSMPFISDATTNHLAFNVNTYLHFICKISISLIASSQKIYLSLVRQSPNVPFFRYEINFVSKNNTFTVSSATNFQYWSFENLNLFSCEPTLFFRIALVWSDNFCSIIENNPFFPPRWSCVHYQYPLIWAVLSLRSFLRQ